MHSKNASESSENIAPPAVVMPVAGRRWNRNERKRKREDQKAQAELNAEQSRKVVGAAADVGAVGGARRGNLSPTA